MRMTHVSAGRVLQEQQKFDAALVYLHQAVKAAAGGMAGSRHNFALGELLVRLGHLPEGSHYLQVQPSASPSFLHNRRLAHADDMDVEIAA